MMLSLIDILYIVLIFFTCIIGTLLTLILIKVLRVLEVVDEILFYYGRVKKVFWMYANIPQMIKEKIKSFM